MRHIKRGHPLKSVPTHHQSTSLSNCLIYEIEFLSFRKQSRWLTRNQARNRGWSGDRVSERRPWDSTGEAAAALKHGHVMLLQAILFSSSLWLQYQSSERQEKEGSWREAKDFCIHFWLPLIVFQKSFCQKKCCNSPLAKSYEACPP